MWVGGGVVGEDGGRVLGIRGAMKRGVGGVGGNTINNE